MVRDKRAHPNNPSITKCLWVAPLNHKAPRRPFPRPLSLILKSEGVLTHDPLWTHIYCAAVGPPRYKRLCLLCRVSVGQRIARRECFPCRHHRKRAMEQCRQSKLPRTGACDGNALQYALVGLFRRFERLKSRRPGNFPIALSRRGRVFLSPSSLSRISSKISPSYESLQNVSTVDRPVLNEPQAGAQ